MELDEFLGLLKVFITQTTTLNFMACETWNFVIQLTHQVPRWSVTRSID